MFQMDLTERAALHLARLKKLGYDVVASDDFAEIEHLVQQTGKPFRSPMFDLRRNDFHKGQAFCLFLVRDGEVIGGVAAKQVALGAESFWNYMQRVSERQFDMDAPLRAMAAPIGERVRGNLVYFGELHFAERMRGRRSVLREHSRLAIVLAAMTWPDFDWMYALIPYEHRSLQDVYGFAMITHHALTWCDPAPYLYRNDLAMVYSAKVDLLHQLAVGETDQPAKH